MQDSDEKPKQTALKQVSKEKRRRKTPRVRHALEYGALRLLAAFLRLLPRRGVEWIGRALGLAVWYGLSSRRRIALCNLELAFGDAYTESQRRRIARASMSHFGYWFLEMMTYEGMDRKPGGAHGLSSGVRSGLERGARKRQGFIFLLTHFSNWELLGLYLGQGAFGPSPTAIVAKAIHNPWIDRWLQRVRTQTGNELIYAHEAGMKILRALRQNKAVAILFDQDTRLDRGGVYSTFFGQGCITYRAVASYSLATGAPIVSAWCLPLPGGRFEIHLDRVKDSIPRRIGRKTSSV
jgi:KDO2-lipid IV(A) lauroyltransferase